MKFQVQVQSLSKLNTFDLSLVGFRFFLENVKPIKKVDVITENTILHNFKGSIFWGGEIAIIHQNKPKIIAMIIEKQYLKIKCTSPCCKNN